MSVRLVDYSPEHLPQLLEFLSEWGKQHPEIASADKLQWQRCNLYLALKDNDIVGCIGQIPQVFHYGLNTDKYGSKEHIGWAINLILNTADDADRKKAGRLLLSRCENIPSLKYGGVGMVPEVEGVYERRGHVIRRDCSFMYGRFTRSVKVLKYLNKSIWWSPLMKTANLIIPKRRIKDGYCKAVTEFKPEWDQIWQLSLSKTYELYAERTADYLNYKLSQPNMDYHVLLYYARQQSDSPDGYLIYRLAQHKTRDLRLVKICDYVGTLKAKSRLISEAIRFADSTDNYGIVAIGGIEDKGIFKSAGLYISSPYPIALSPTIKTRVHITFFDSDLDNLW